MTDLTEQWKKGELLEGFYYVKDGENLIAEYLDGYFYNNGEPMTSFSGGVDEVLDKVPSYSEYLALQSDSLAKKEAVEINAELENSIKDLKHRNENLRLALKTYELPEIQKILTDWRTGELDKKFNKLEKENAQLKDLLKECQKSISWYQETYGAMDLDTYTLLAKLNEVLNGNTSKN